MSLGSAMPDKDGACYAAADHVLDLRVDLSLSVRDVADTHVIRLSEPAQPSGVNLGR